MLAARFPVFRSFTCLGLASCAFLAMGLQGARTLATVVTFQNGTNGYSGTQDTFLQQDPANAGTNNGAGQSVGWDGDDPAGTGLDQYTLIRFDSFIGGGANLVPPGAQITEATLVFTIFDTGDTGELREVQSSWSESSTFTSFCGATCDEGVEFGPSIGTVPSGTATTVSVVVTSTVQAWVDGAPNNGWIITPTGGGGVDARSSEYATVAQRPQLVVRHSEGPPSGGNLEREPYLQLVTPTSVSVLWRSEIATDSRVRYGTVQGSLGSSATNASVTVDHAVNITGLSPNTRYYYDVGSTIALQGGGSAAHYFETAPVIGSTAPFRVWLVGDGGNGSSTQVNVMNAMLTAAGANPPDFALYLGDIAYNSGTDSEFTTNYFTPYENLLRNTAVWPTLGNHEAISVNTTSQTGPYYQAFALPTGGQAGGVASGTEAYYSFDYGNVHFISLDSQDSSRALGSPMLTWLASDIASTAQQWVVAFWHHPPYSHGTHNSDSAGDSGGRMVEMRERVLPILEMGGVDLVLSGHSHNYERSFLIDGVYGFGSGPNFQTPNYATLAGSGRIKDDGDGRISGDGAYLKSSGQNPNEGAVYVVAGNGGQGTGGSGLHPVMFFRELANGSCLMDVTGNMLSIQHVRIDGVITDNFQIVKGDLPPRVVSAVPAREATLSGLTSVTVTFSVAVTGVSPDDLSVNGSQATSLSGSGAGPYVFTGFIPPSNGLVSVAMAADGIADAGNPLLLFGGDTWHYTIDTTPPIVASEVPTRNSVVAVLPSIHVEFSKPVTGVVAGNLTVNGSPATALSAVSGTSGPYEFSGFATPGEGLVTVSLASGAIQDDLAQGFVGDTWAYALEQRLIINEFLASNNTAVTDEFGDFDDWLEIYNPGSVPVDMSGMYLTDNLGFPTQYQIPAGVSIGPGGYLVFWCDSESNEGALHTNFNLARTGEDIGLFDTAANGFAQIDAFTYGTQTTDISSGRFPDGAGAPTVSFATPTPGAPNTIDCSVNSDCAALNDDCVLGTCPAGVCVAVPANEGGACDDGVACTLSDVCISGTCEGTADCPALETCNLLTGLCESGSPLPPLPIVEGDIWRYFRGVSEPPSNWAILGFIDSGWEMGPSGFGYGDDDDNTILDAGNPPAMLNNYASIYIRRTFNVVNVAAVTSVTLSVDYDDAYVCYLNGAEVARSANISGTPPAFDALASAGHEASGGDSTPQPPHVTNPSPSSLQSGANVIACQGHNQTLGSSDFSLIPELDIQATCTVPADCDDGELCTNDVCTAGNCSNPPVSCPPGETCNPGTGSCEAAPVMVSFQQGVGGYTSSFDTFLHAGSATANNGAAVTLVVDGPPPAADERQVLIRFDNVFGNGAGQIPLGSTIQSATLTIQITNASLTGANLHRMLQTWTAADNWNTWIGGIQANGVEAVAVADVSSFLNATGSHAISVTNSVAAWSAGATNFGWVLLSGGDDSWQFDSAEGATVANRPRLQVTYLAPGGGCTDNSDCNDSNVCTTDVCQSNVCVNSPVAGCCTTAAQCNDGDVCTNDACVSNACQYTNNSAPCTDGNSCTTNDTCSSGTCVGGQAPNCDDGNACTTDTCVPASGCQNANNTLPCNDNIACTGGDTCSGGVCAGINNCPGGQTCNIGTGLCEAGPTMAMFQDGFGGYTGTVDTYIDAALGSQATASPIVVDSSPVEQVLIRFDDIFGPGAGQVPPGSTITSATLTLWSGAAANDQSANPVNLHRLLNSWADTSVWAAYGVAPWNATAGIQPDGVDALAAIAATFSITTAATSADIDVTSSLQAWSSNPAGNFGWVILPTGTDGLRLESSESTTASNARRPKLTVNYQSVGSTLLCQQLSSFVAAGSSASLEIYARNTPNLRGYEVAIMVTRTSGTGTGTVTCPGGVTIDTNHPEFVYEGLTPGLDYFITVDCPNRRAAGSLVTGTTPVGMTPEYLAEYFIDISGDAALGSTFEVSIVPASSFLVDGAGANIPFTIEPVCVINVGCTLNSQCDDGLFCNGAETCVSGACQAGTAPNCDDGVACTIDSCNEGTDNCDHIANDVVCGDGLFCNGAEVCHAIAGCQSGTAPDCDDAIACTVDSCNEGTDSCDHVVNNAPCSDGLFCNGAEICQAGVGCVAGTNPCPSLPCDEPTDTCITPTMSCAPTSSFAFAGGMVGLDILAANVSNLRAYQTTIAIVRTSGTGTVMVDCPGGVSVDTGRGDFVFAGFVPGVDFVQVTNCALMRASASMVSSSVSVGTTPSYLADYELTVSGDATNGSTFEISIVPATSFFVNPGGTSIPFVIAPACQLTVGCSLASDCDDGNPCTTDSCVANNCLNTNNSLPCSDGNACTSGDSCSGGSCIPGPALNCDDGNVCTGDACNPSIGCQYVNVSGACNDNDACTTADSCAGGLCIGGLPPDCNDGNDCTDDSCHSTLGCQHANTLSGTSCGSGSDTACDNPDICNGSGACLANTEPDGTSCTDGIFCNGDETCQGGVCTPGIPPPGCCTTDEDCANSTLCDGIEMCSGNTCVSGTPLNCNDGNPCTDDSCHPTLGCQHVGNSGPCSDGDVCTTGDMCSGGACVGGAPTSCNDGNLCTDDFCTPGVGCEHSANTSPCGDGDACTTMDTCSGGVCVGGPPPDCDDGNVCTDDSCNVFLGCLNTNNNGPCSDNNACTANDQCLAGLCVGVPVNCNDTNICTDDSCNPGTGCVNQPNVSPCDDGLFCTLIDQCSAGICAGSGDPCSGNACDEINDMCDGAISPPTQAPAPFNRAHNRYLSFAPNNPGVSAAFRVRKLTAPTGTCWVQAPVPAGPADQFTAKCDVAPVFRIWNEPVVHVGDCEIIPVADYEIAATAEGLVFSSSLAIGTTPLPALNSKLWGDTVGINNGVEWTPPNQLTNVNDVLAILHFITSSLPAPIFASVNLQAVSAPDSCLNPFVNTADVLISVRAIAGDSYGPPNSSKIIDPTLCPICP